MNDRRRMKQETPGSSPAARRSWRPWALISLVLCLGLSLVQASPGLTFAVLADRQSMQATTITIVPTPATIQGCGTVYVDVWVNDVVDLYAADFRISFDPARLEVVDADSGTPGVQIELLNGFLKPDFPVKRDADNTVGTIWYAVTQLNPTPPANGSGALARITFRAKATGPASASLHFTYTKLAELNGVQIPATPTDGTADTIPPASPTLSISRLNSTTARLTWTTSPGIAEYHLYRDTMPYFAPAAPPYVTTTGLTYDDVGALGDVVIQYYYVIRSACATGFESANSNRVGAYDYALRSTAATNYNDIALVLHVDGVNDAASLATYVGSSVRRVYWYNAATQAFRTYIVGFPSTNFPLTIGDFVFVLTDNTAPASTALVGGVPDPTTVSFSLVSGSPPRNNYLSLPLDQGALTTASQVAADVGAGVYRVMRYRIETQTYQAYIPGFPVTDFSLVIGEPFALVLSSGAPTRWPVYPPSSTQ